MKLRLFLLVAIVLGFSTAAAAQYPIALGSEGREYGKAITVDGDGNIVVVVLFENAIDFDPGAGTEVIGTAPGVDCAIAKYTPRGELVFARNVSGTAASPAAVVTPHGVQTSALDNIYVIGYFGMAGGAPATVDFDPGASAVALTNTGGWDPFVAKYDPEGNLLWARTIGSTSANTQDERSWDLAIDAEGSVYFTGFVNGTYDLDGTAGTRVHTSRGGTDAFLAKYDANGSFVWGFGIGGTGDDEGFSVALRSGGEVYLQGDFSGTVDMDPGAGTFELTSAGGTDVFLSRFDANGGLLDAMRVGGTLADTTPPGTMRTDGAGNLYLSGRFRGTVDLDPGAGISEIANTTTADNLFVATYTPALELRWGFAVASDGALDGGHRVAVDGEGNVFVAGWFAGNADFDPGAGASILSSNGTGGASDVFLAKYDPDGGFLWANQFGARESGADSFSIAAGLALDGEGNSYITGQYYGEADFDPSGGERVLANAGMNDAFVAKYTPDGRMFVNAGEDRRPAITGAVFDGKRLRVTGENFDAGAVVLVGDAELRTRADAGNANVLVARRAAKAIARGQTVTLYVRNADGALSDPFAFTRPE